MLLTRLNSYLRLSLRKALFFLKITRLIGFLPSSASRCSRCASVTFAYFPRVFTAKDAPLLLSISCISIPRQISCFRRFCIISLPSLFCVNAALIAASLQYYASAPLRFLFLRPSYAHYFFGLLLGKKLSDFRAIRRKTTASRLSSACFSSG